MIVGLFICLLPTSAVTCHAEKKKPDLCVKLWESQWPNGQCIRPDLVAW